MPRSHSSLGRLGAAVLTTSVVACLAIGAPASAATSGNVTVSGASVSVIDLTITDPTAQFGTNLTPDGAASNAAAPDVVGVSTGAPGACYNWAGSAVVKSNLVYKVAYSAAAVDARLRFLTAAPAASYANCTAGTGFQTASTTWVNNQVTTASTTHSFWLGLSVLWTAAPDPTIGATLTLTASAAP